MWATFFGGLLKANGAASIPTGSAAEKTEKTDSIIDKCGADQVDRLRSRHRLEREEKPVQELLRAFVLRIP